MLIAIVNQSTWCQTQDAATMTQAIAAQVRLDVAPLWDRAPAAVIFYTNAKDVPVAAHGIACGRHDQRSTHGSTRLPH